MGFVSEVFRDEFLEGRIGIGHNSFFPAPEITSRYLAATSANISIEDPMIS